MKFDKIAKQYGVFKYLKELYQILKYSKKVCIGQNSKSINKFVNFFL